MRQLPLILLAMFIWAPAAALAQPAETRLAETRLAETRLVDPELLLARQTTLDQGLFFALARNDLQSMSVLRNQGANPNASLSILGLKVKEVFGSESPLLDQPFDPAGWPVLHWAVYLGNIDAVKLLLRGGARVNAVDVYGATALHWAAWGGRHSIGKLLLNNGASCWAADIKRRTPKDWAIMTGQDAMVQLLAARTCRPGAVKDSDGDGVPDHLDLCPNTPSGAQVDDRGCWVAAYANFFDFDKSIVKPQYLPHLVSAAETLKLHPELRVDVQGHTDAVGGDDYNYKLGLRRAEAVKRVLTANGVAAERLSVSSQGKRQPIADNRSTNGRALNRRVEIHVAEAGAPPPAAGRIALPASELKKVAPPPPAKKPRAAKAPTKKAAAAPEETAEPGTAPPSSAPALPPASYSPTGD